MENIENYMELMGEEAIQVQLIVRPVFDEEDGFVGYLAKITGDDGRVPLLDDLGEKSMHSGTQGTVQAALAALDAKCVTNRTGE